MPPITPLQEWLYNWGGVTFLAVVIAWRLLIALLGVWDGWRSRRMYRGPHKPWWRKVTGRISY